MALKYLTNINLLQNELQNAVIQVLAVAPQSGKEGQIYYNSADKLIYRYDGTQWGAIGVVYSQASTTGAVVTGLDANGNVTTTSVTGLTLAGYTPVSGGYISDGMTIEAAFKALDEAVKNAVAGGGEVNQNAWSNITVKQQSTATTAVTGQATEATISASAKTDTFAVASGNKWVDVGSDGKQINIGHALSGATAGSMGDATHVPAITYDAAGHITGVESKEIVGAEYITTLTGDAQTQLDGKVPNTRTVNGKALNADITLTAADVNADPAGSADAVLGSDGDASTAITVYGARKLAQEALDAAEGITVPEYTIVKDGTAQTGYFATYYLSKAGSKVGEYINIPKDYLVKSAEVKVSTGGDDPSGLPQGTTYIDFVINAYSGEGNESHVYLNAADLVDVYTAGNGVEISATNVVSAKVVAANGLSVDADGIKLGVASADNNGAMTSAMVTKLNGVADGATANTITLNGTTNANPSFYAPTTAGTEGQIIAANAAGVPTWQDAPEKFHKYVASNAAITASGGAYTWNIAASVHGVDSNGIIVQLYEVATGDMVMADIKVAPTTRNVTITINGDGTLAANTYSVVICG